MRRSDSLAIALAVSLATVTIVAPAAAQGPKGPKAGAQTAKGGPKTSTTETASKGFGGAKSGKTTKGVSAKKSTTATTTTAATTGTDTGSTTTPPATTTHAAEPNAISTRISRNPQQRARLTSRLPAGMTLEAASAGFRNQGQFIAAVNASHSQNVPFSQLKTEMVENGLSLGQAVKKVRSTPAVPAPAPAPNPTQPSATNPPAPTTPPATNPAPTPGTGTTGAK